MTLEQIDYFICTVQSGLFDAAETMHISQSSLSKQIMKLEKNWTSPYGIVVNGLLCLLLQGNFFIKKHLRFPDSIIVPWNQCPILRTVNPRPFISEPFLFSPSTISLL